MASPLFGCAASDVGDNEPSAVSLANNVQTILDARCVQCHFLESAQGELVLEQGEAFASLVNIPSSQAPMNRVEPGNPDRSYLMHKLRGTHHSVGGSGSAMPLGGEVSSGLSTDDMALIQTWIVTGAHDN